MAKSNLTGLNTVTLGKLPYTVTSPDEGSIHSYQLNRLMERSIKNILFFKNFKTLKTLVKRGHRPKYLFSTIQFNKKQYFLRNRRIAKSRTRAYYSAGSLRLEPVILNRVSFMRKKAWPDAAEATKAMFKGNAVRFIKHHTLLRAKMAVLKDIACGY